ncbi:MAG: vitamin K epoxide reductase family protein [Solirubrobacteraceae bacterium]
MTVLDGVGSRAATGDRRLPIAIAVLCLLGIGIAAYLTYVHYEGLTVSCPLGGHGCETVQSSAYAKLDGIPVAVLGLAGYIAILLSLAVRGDPGRAAGFGVALIGFGFSLYLTYRELFTIKAICQWCVGSAVLMTALAILTAWAMLRGGDRPQPIP